ncbi:MAG: hypothetical protein IPM24_27450 [Bryobacterales bacterium]|nr:hypothetical protein [Bryobacterales bacterium]
MSKGLSIALLPLARRRMGGVKTVSSGALNRTIPQDEYVERCISYQREAERQHYSMPRVVDGLWRCEGLSTTLGKYRLPENTLADPRLPPAAWGITHVGYGAASTEFAHFDDAKLHEIARTCCHPDNQGFFYEGIGSIVRIYEPGIFKFMCGMLGLIPKGAPPGPDRDGFYTKFFTAFDDEQARLIVHGYGRLVGFSKISVYAAIGEAMQLPQHRVEACVQGIAFAFAMMNAEEMPRLLENSAIEYPDPVRRAFQTGLTYGMVFCDWFAPGFLAAWKPAGPLEEKLIGHARREAEINRQAGRIPAFALHEALP